MKWFHPQPYHHFPCEMVSSSAPPPPPISNCFTLSPTTTPHIKLVSSSVWCHGIKELLLNIIFPTWNGFTLSPIITSHMKWFHPHPNTTHHIKWFHPQPNHHSPHEMVSSSVWCHGIKVLFMHNTVNYNTLNPSSQNKDQTQHPKNLTILSLFKYQYLSDVLFWWPS